MKNWKYWLLLAVMTVFLGVAMSFTAIDISRGKVSSPAAACFILLVFLGGVLVGSYGRDKALEYALIAGYGASLALYEWFGRRSLVSLVLWMIFALIFAGSSWQTRKAARSRAGSSRSGPNNDQNRT